MAGSYEIKIIAKDEGSLKKILAGLKGVNEEVDKTASSHRRASAAADNFNHRMDKGIIGTANSSKSFSKLAQSIDGDHNSLVGAYAALAANIFAVSAAFLALKNAAEVAQVIEGLAASGARLGLSYKNAIVEVRDAADGLLSLEQSARSTAQVLAAGFKTEQLVRLTNAAQDASFALGRDMSESMDRLTRGVIKLEPELLDELGIMVRLDEASATYARTLGKSTSQLTAAEKRQGFYNATIAEAEAKFGGLSNDANNAATALNKLNATFNDLTKTIFGLANFALGGLVKLLGSSQGALLGGMLLFASTIKGQLIPALVDATDRTKKLAIESAKLSGESAQGFLDSKKYKDVDKVSTAYFNTVKKGGGTLEETVAMQQKLNDAILDRTNLSTGGDMTKADMKKGIISSYKFEIEALKEVEKAQLKTATLQSVSNSAIEASQGKVVQSFKHAAQAARYYDTGLKLATTSTSRFSVISRGAAVGAFFLGTAIRSAGVAFLNFLPWLGLITLALSGAWSIIKMIAGDGYAKLTAATKAYNEVLKTSSASLEQYNKLNESTASIFTRVTSQAKIAGNSITSLAEAYKAVVEAQKDTSGFGKFIQGVKERFNFSRAQNLSKLSQSTGLTAQEIDKNYELIQTFTQMQKFKGTSGIIKEIFGTEGPRTIADYQSAVSILNEKYGSLAATVEEVENAFKQGEIAANDFIKSATPTTPYDALSNSLYGINKALDLFNTETLRGSATADELKGIFSGLGPGVFQLTSFGSMEEAMNIVQTKKDGLNIVRQELVAVQETFDTHRNTSLEKQGQLALAQASLTLAGKSSAITAEETAHKINAENSVIALQASQLKLQASVLDSIIRQNKAKLDALDIEEDILKLLKEKSEWELISQNNALLMDPLIVREEKDRLRYNNEQLRKRMELERDINNAEVGRNNLLDQANALLSTATTTKQKDAMTAKTTADSEVFKAQQILRLREDLVAQKIYDSEAQETIFGFSERTEALEEANLAVYEQKLDLIRKQSAATQAEYLVQASLSQTATNRAAYEERARQEREDLLPILEQELKREFDIQSLKNAGFKSEVDRLSTAKDLLDIQLQQAEAIASAAEAQANLNIRQKRLAAGARELTATEERNLAIEAAQASLNAALITQKLKADAIKAEYALLDAQYALEAMKLDNATKALARLKPSLKGDALVAADANIVANSLALDAYATVRKGLSDQEVAALDMLRINVENLRLAVKEAASFAGLSGGAFAPSASMASLASQPSGLLDQDGQPILGKGIGFNKETLSAMHEDIQPFITELKKLGPEGEYVSAVAEGALVMADAIKRIGDSGITSADGLAAVGSVIGEIAKIASAGADAKIAAIDREIAAEQKRDGKSAESVAKIKAMEAKKEATAKKAFEVNKKLQMAQTVVNTASAIVGALANPGGIPGMILAAMYGALGAAQLSVIAGTSYQGGASSAASAATPSALSVGTRSSSVDLAKSNTTVGGEHGYLTGAQGQGTNASNFKPRAYGGYGNAGMIVGEKGPELFVPSTPGTVVSNDNMTQAAPINANISINAIDAEGVERVLTDQRGHIIGMLREAANANGQNFLENVDTIKYRRTGGRRL